MSRGSFSDWQTAALVAFACLFLTACSKAQNAQARPAGDAAVPVQVEQVREESISRAIEVVGTLAAEDEVTISAEAEGRVDRLLADLGDRVQCRPGPARARSREGAVQRRSAEGRLRARARELRRGRRRASTGDGANARGSESAGRARPGAAVVQACRGAEPPAAGASSRRSTTPTRRCAPGRPGYASALQNAKNLRADIDASRAGVKLAERQLRDRSIRAPFDGYVQKRLVALGEYVKTQSPVMSVVRVNPLKVDGRDSGTHGAVGQGRPACSTAGRRLSRQGASPARFRGSARR